MLGTILTLLAVLVVFAFAASCAFAINRFVVAEERQPYGQLIGAATTACVALIAATWAWQAVQEQLTSQSQQIAVQSRIANANLSDQLERRRIALRELSTAISNSRKWLSVAGDIPVETYIVRDGDKIRLALTTLAERRIDLKQIERDATSMLILNARSALSDEARSLVGDLAHCVGIVAITAQRPILLIEGFDNMMVVDPVKTELQKKITEAESDIAKSYKDCAAVWDKVHSSVFAEVSALNATIKSLGDDLNATQRPANK